MTLQVRFQKLDDRAVAPAYGSASAAGADLYAVADAPITIDADYRGEVMVALHNHSGESRTIESGERIAQLVLVSYLTAAYEQADSLTDTARGDGGFGSTGTK